MKRNAIRIDSERRAVFKPLTWVVLEDPKEPTGDIETLYIVALLHLKQNKPIIIILEE